MDAHAAWSDYFQKWPKEMPRKGILVTQFGEQIPFEGFMTTADLLLLERRTPDTIGARKVVLPYGQVVAIKLIEVVRAKLFQAAGFAGICRTSSDPCRKIRYANPAAALRSAQFL